MLLKYLLLPVVAVVGLVVLLHLLSGNAALHLTMSFGSLVVVLLELVEGTGAVVFYCLGGVDHLCMVKGYRFVSCVSGKAVRQLSRQLSVSLFQLLDVSTQLSRSRNPV